MSSNKDNKLHYATMLLLEYAGGALQRTNLNKALFYLDLYWLLDRGETFTGATYVAIARGPVVDQYRERLLPALLATGKVIEQVQVISPKITAMRLMLQAGVEPPKDEHLEVLARRVAEWASGRTAVDLSEISHENLGWKTAFEAKVGSSIDMALALDQLVDDDPWLDEELTPEEKRRINERLSSGRFVTLE